MQKKDAHKKIFDNDVAKVITATRKKYTVSFLNFLIIFFR